MATKPRPKPTNLSAVDAEALERALALTRAENKPRAMQIDDMLATRDWLRVATFASYSQQDRVLACKPWETVPMQVEVDERVEPPDLGQRRRAIKLLRKLLALGLSKYEPDIINAIERAERAKEVATDAAAIAD
jgi:hypothetical protein